MKKLKWSLKIICLQIVIVTILMTGAVYATTNSYPKLQQKEYSKQFKEWLELTPEEKSKTIMPEMYDITNNTNTISKADNIFEKELKNMIKATVSETPKYRLDEDGVTIKVKDQGYTGECWAFSLTSVLETTCSKTASELAGKEFSPRHMDYSTVSTYTDKTLTEDTFLRVPGGGGNFMNGLAYITSGIGPVYEEEMPVIVDKKEELISSSEVEGFTPKAMVKEAVYFDSVYKVKSGDTIVYYASANNQTQDTILEEKDILENRENIKTHIMTYGAVSASIGGSLNEDIYNIENRAYYSTSLNAGHAVTIIGWDDTYSKDNFVSTNKPSTDGAWVVLQSYGTSENTVVPEMKDVVGDGFFYISYEDALIEGSVRGIREVTEIDYDYLYQHDKLGMTGGIEYLQGSQAKIRSEFSKKSPKEETITEIGLYSWDTKYATVTYQDSTTNETEIISKTLIHSGYNTIKLKSPQTINNNSYKIIVKYENEDSSNNILVIPTESVVTGASNPKLSGKCDISVYYQGSYTDWSAPEDLGASKCDWNIHVYTTVESSEPTGITLDKTIAKIAVNESIKLNASITPQDATEKIGITWTSSDNSIATVSTEGLVSALKEGNVTITATTENGLQATCAITVLGESSIPTNITTDETAIELTEGETKKITATVLPNTAEQSVTWSSNNEAVATVDNNGTITAKKEGTAVITVASAIKNSIKQDVNVTVKAKEIKSISWKTQPTKKEYVQNVDRLDLTGGVLLITYIDDTTNEIELPSSEVETSGFDNTKVGTKTITLTYKGKTITFDIEVVVGTQEKTVSSIKIKKQPDKVTYLVGEDIKLDGGIITVTYSDGTTEDIEMTNPSVVITGYDKNTAKIQTITVNYKNKLATFTVTVTQTPQNPTVSSIKIKQLPTKTTYSVGEELKLDGGQITVTYSDGTTKDISMTDSEVKVSGYDKNKTGTQQLTVSYGSKLATFSVSVNSGSSQEKTVTNIRIKKLPNKTTYNKGDKIDLSGGTLTVTYSDGSTEDIEMTDSRVGVQGFDSSKTGVQTVTLSYGAKSTTLSLKVNSSSSNGEDNGKQNDDSNGSEEEDDESNNDNNKEKKNEEEKEEPVDTGDNIKSYITYMIISLGVIIFVSIRIKKM